jgi:hypothetical protein
VSPSADSHSPLPPRRLGRALLALLLALLAPLAWGLTLGSPALRASGAAAWLLLATALLLAFSAARADRRPLVRVLASLVLLIAAALVWFFFSLATLRPQPAADELQSAPDFTLPDQQGRPVTLSERLSAGPILLVFYRGHW